MVTGFTPGTIMIIAAIGLVAWLLLRNRKGEPKGFHIPQFMFSTTQVNKLNAESVMGAMITAHGGQKENPGAVAILRTGRAWRKATDGRDPGTLRRRQAVYVTRHGDAAPLNLRYLFIEGGSIFGAVLKDDMRPIKNLAIKNEMAGAVQRSSTRDVLTKRLSLVAVISVTLGAASWLSITIFGLFQATAQ